MKKRPIALLCLALAAPFARAEIDLAAVAPAGFSRGVVLRVDGYARAEDRATLTNFPALVRVSPAAIPGFDYADCLFGDGGDIRFLDADGNLIPGEVDEWNPDGESLVWVALPRMTNGTEFAMFYGAGDPGAPAAGDVWERYAVVIHGGDSIANSVAGGPVATAGSAYVAAAADAGRVGGGIRKSVANAVGVNVTNVAAALADTGRFSVSAWFKRNGNGGADNGTHVLGASRPAWNGGTGFLWLQEQGKYISVAARGSHQWSDSARKLEDGEWAHVAFAYEKDVLLTSYFDGAQDQARTYPGSLENTSSGFWTFGSYQNTASRGAFTGDMDELRVFDGAATRDWIRAEHDTMADASFLSAGPVAHFGPSPSPVAGISAPPSGIGVTNAALAAKVGSLGTGADWADLLLLVGADEGLSDPLFRVALDRAASAPTSMVRTIGPLATNATYYAKILATNALGVAGESAVLAFTTRSPGPPSGTGAFLAHGPARIVAEGAVTDYGYGAGAATIRLEASADGFATYSSSAGTNAVLGAAATFAIDGLAPNTDYQLRLRIENDWGLVAYVPLPGTYVTRAGLVGLYAFDRTNPFEAAIGSPAKEGTAGNRDTAVALSDTISALSLVTDPAVLGDRTGVVAVPSYSTLAIPNPGLRRNWTIALWFYAPRNAAYHCFFQFNPANDEDGSLFLYNGSQIGCDQYTPVSGAIGAWHQLTVSSANDVQTIWYDRQRLGQTRNWSIAGMSLLQFSLDNDGEDAPLYFDEIRLYDETAPEDVFPDGLAGGPVLLDPWTEAPYADDWGSFSRTPDRVIESAPWRTYVFSRHGTVSFVPFKRSPESSLLLVGGGGAGGMMRGGGGGAGGVVGETGLALEARSYSFEVGAGGVPDIHSSWYVDKEEADRTLHEGPTTAAACGGETTFSDFSGAVLRRAAGGGGGGNFNYAGGDLPDEGYGLDGASGGGASCKSTQPGLGTAGQGHAGGEAQTDGDGSGGGGGGAGAPGSKGTSSVPGAGGDGVENSITGEPVVYGGGGGASSYERVGGRPGSGGGGTGVPSTDARLRSVEANGVDGLGGGGGGGSGRARSPYNSTGGRGGDGAAILRVRVPDGSDPEPTVAVFATEVGHTNATFEVRLLSLGDGAGSAGVTFRLSASADMSDPFFETNLAAAATAVPVSFAPAYAPLLTNTLYYARATAVNDRGETGLSALVSFRTPEPEPPAVGLTPAGAGFGSVAATANLASFGAGSTDATVYLDCSLLGDFSDAVSSAGVAVSALPFTQTLMASGLLPGTTYRYRVRAVNTWGVEGVSATFETVTESAPVRLSEMSATPAADGTQTISVTTLAVEPGTTYTLSISIDGNTVQTWTGQTEPRTFSASYAGTGTHSALARAVSSFGGRTYSASRSIGFSADSMRFIVTDYANHCSSATAIRVHAGDRIVLPPLRFGWRYRVLNDRFLALDGLEATALEPAVAGIEVYNGTTLMGTMAVLVLPEAIEGGDVYVYDETVNANDRVWTDAAAWDKIGSATDSRWPCNPNDIAVIPFHDTKRTVCLRHASDLSLGGILFGSFRDVTAECVLERTEASSASVVAFSRTDGEPAFVKVTPNTGSGRSSTLRFGGDRREAIACGSSVETDSCSSPTNSALHRGYVSYSSCTVHIPEGLYWAVDGLPGYNINMAPTVWPPKLTGEGLFWKRGMGGLQFGSQPNFHGTIVDSSHGHLDGFSRAAPTFWHDGAGGTNVSVAIAGWVAPRLGNPSVSAGGYGWFRTGWDPGYGSDGPHPDVPWNPRKTMTLRGGAYDAYSTENSGWGKGVRNSRIYERLAVGAGMSYVGESERGNNGGHPINYIEWNELEHADKGTLAIYDPSRRYVAATASETNAMTVVPNHGAFLVGHGRDGDCLFSDAYPIVPWIVAPCSTAGSSWQDTLFASFDEDGRLTRPVWNDTALDEARSPYSNAYLWDKAIAIGRDVAVNSLFMNNGGKGKLLGEGRTLAIASGGLVMHGKGTAIGQPDGDAANGALVLGDADHPGYVFAKSSDRDQPNQIWADVTAPGGFVSSWSGALVLGGSQTNILDELVANAGVLALGTTNHACTLAKDLPVRVCAGATLVAPRPDAVRKCHLRFDGAGGQFGRIELPDGVAAQCKTAWWRDYPRTPEWQCLPHGTYGSSDSGVAGEFVRDDLFSGTGTLRVVQDDHVPPTMLILR